MNRNWFVPRWRAPIQDLDGQVANLSALVGDLSGRCARLDEEIQAGTVQVEEIRQRFAVLVSEASERDAAARRQTEDLARALETLARLASDGERADGVASAHEQRMRDVTDSVERLRLRLVALETQRVWDSEEMRRSATGLFEHIERLRRTIGAAAS